MMVWDEIKTVCAILVGIALFVILTLGLFLLTHQPLILKAADGSIIMVIKNYPNGKVKDGTYLLVPTELARSKDNY
jgi:hypothetical protein